MLGTDTITGASAQDGEDMALGPGRRPEDGLLTAGAVSPSGDAVVLRTYGQLHLYARAPGSTIAATLTGTSCEGEVAEEPQGEAVTFSADGSGYLTLSEGVGQPINRYAPR